MIDIHLHILPGLDDGAQDMDEALDMCRIAVADGVHTIVASPHCRNGLYDNDEHTIMPAVGALREALRKEGISLTVIPSVEMHITTDIFTFFAKNARLLLGGRYILLELPHQSIPPHTREFIFTMRLKGYVPIITHPERNTIIQSNPDMLRPWVDGGAIMQVTAMSLIGGFGPEIRDVAVRLVESGLVHCIATDAHSSSRRKPLLSEARKMLESMLGSERADDMVNAIPAMILRGEPIERADSSDVEGRVPSLMRRLLGNAGKAKQPAQRHTIM
jgi:protein-tyrosine phosphatase